MKLQQQFRKLGLDLPSNVARRIARRYNKLAPEDLRALAVEAGADELEVQNFPKWKNILFLFMLKHPQLLVEVEPEEPPKKERRPKDREKQPRAIPASGVEGQCDRCHKIHPPKKIDLYHLGWISENQQLCKRCRAFLELMGYDLIPIEDVSKVTVSLHTGDQFSL